MVMVDVVEGWKIEAAKEVTGKRERLLEQRRALIESHQKRIREIDYALSELSISARSLSLPVNWLADGGDTNISADLDLSLMPRLIKAASSPQPMPFKDRALSLLAEAYPAPLKAAEIREKIESEYRTKFHEKTAGMSLYRLSKEGLVRREGKDLWFFVPEDQRNKENPGSGSEPEDPGSLL